MIWLIRSSPGLRRSRSRWPASQSLNPTMPSCTCWNCCHDSPMSRLGAPSSPNSQDARPVFVGHAEDVADDGDRKLRAVAVDDVDDGGVVASSSSSSVVAVCSTRSRSAATALVVNTDDTSLRYCVWSGGSTDSSDGGRSGCSSPGSVFLEIQRSGSGRLPTQFGDAEVVGAQQFVRDAVVDGHQHGAAPDHRASVAEFVGERAGVLPHLGVGDQPRLRVAAAKTELREASDDAVQREPADSLPHSAELTTAGTVVQASNSGALAERVHPPARRLPLRHVEAIAAVHNDFRAHGRGQLLRVEVDELLPLGEHQHGVGALARLDHRRRVVQRREDAAASSPSPWGRRR